MAISVSTKEDRALVNGTHIDDEITQIWKDVEARVVQMAGGDPSKVKQGLDIDAVLQQLDEAQSKDKKASEKYSTVKNIFSRTLQCIQTVGGIVANGASNVCL
jgi:ethanolamine utilization microcompartment shell protein EutL